MNMQVSQGCQEMWQAVMARSFMDAKTDETARQWLYTRHAEDVAELAGWDLDAWRIFLDRVNARGWDAPKR